MANRVDYSLNEFGAGHFEEKCNRVTTESNDDIDNNDHYSDDEVTELDHFNDGQISDEDNIEENHGYNDDDIYYSDQEDSEIYWSDESTNYGGCKDDKDIDWSDHDEPENDSLILPKQLNDKYDIAYLNSKQISISVSILLHDKVYSLKRDNIRGMTLERLGHGFMSFMQYMENAGLDKQVCPSVRLSISVTDENILKGTIINILYNKR